MSDLDLWLANGAMGVAVAVAVFSCRQGLGRFLDLVEADLADKLRRLRAPAEGLRKFLIAWLGAVACILFGFWLVLGSLIFGLLFSVFLLCGPWYAVRRMAERRRQKIEDQLADAMVTLANAVKAGLSLPQSLEILAAQGPAPLNVEFQQIVTEYNMGKPLEEALTEAKTRLDSENFTLFAAALLASHESGGRLNETVERIAQAIIESQRLERKIVSETAQARRSAVYMALAPALILLVYYFIDPDATTRLFVTLPGQLILAIAVVFNVVAFVWARAILNPDI